VARSEGAPLTLLHHRGRKSGKEYVAPVMYQAEDSSADTIYVFASKAGAPTNPDWYYNLTAAGSTTVEVGTETYEVDVAEVIGADRDRVPSVRDRSSFGDSAHRAQQALAVFSTPRTPSCSRNWVRTAAGRVRIRGGRVVGGVRCCGRRWVRVVGRVG
jgi:deazaflavin-dependent oxidoreductase (nitroreductase family)